MKRIALTGGIASGKTTVGHFFEELGVPVLWADEISKKLYLKNSNIYQQILKRYGNNILDETQEISHVKLGQILFHQPQEKLWLESILHPATFQAIEQKIQELSQKNPPFILVEAALHVETHYYRKFDGLIVVDVSPEIQLERLIQRNHLSAEEAKQRIRNQLPLAEKRKYADWVIDNSGPKEATQKQVKQLFNILTANN